MYPPPLGHGRPVVSKYTPGPTQPQRTRRVYPSGEEAGQHSLGIEPRKSPDRRTMVFEDLERHAPNNGAGTEDQRRPEGGGVYNAARLLWYRAVEQIKCDCRRGNTRRGRRASSASRKNSATRQGTCLLRAWSKFIVIWPNCDLDALQRG